MVRVHVGVLNETTTSCKVSSFLLAVERYFAVVGAVRSVLLWPSRLVIVLLAVGFLTPAPFRFVPMPPQTLITENPHVCVHTDLIHEVDEWKIERSLSLAREMGASTIVEFFPWAYVEAERGVYDWRQADRIVHHARNQDVTIIARMGLVPDWARPDDSTLNTLPPESDRYFAEFVTAFAARYAGIIDHIIIWNEPNLAFEWGFADFSPERYVDLLRVAHDGARRGNPDVVVLAGALAPTLEPDDSANGLNDLLYLERMYQAGAADYFDALAVHTYGFNQPADAPPAPDLLNFRRAELLYAIMAEHGDGDKPVYITESGWNDSPRWTYGVSPSARIAHTLDAFRIVADDWEQAQRLCLWIFRHPTPRNSYRDDYTLITPEFQIKPIYYAVQAYALGAEADGAPLWLPAPQESH